MLRSNGHTHSHTNNGLFLRAFKRSGGDLFLRTMRENPNLSLEEAEDVPMAQAKDMNLGKKASANLFLRYILRIVTLSTTGHVDSMP